MKKILLFFIVAISATAIALGQDVSKLSISTQIFLDKLNGTIQVDQENLRKAKAAGLKPVAGTFEAAEKESQFVADPVVVNGQNYMSAFVRLEDPAAIGKLESLGVEIQEQFLDGKLVTALIPVDKIEEVAAIASVKSVKAATLMRKSTNTARQKTNVDDVLTYSADAQSAGLPSAFDGSGVVLGVIDTGIDFNHIAFKDKDGNSRIKKAYVYNGSSAQEYSSISSSTLTDDKSEDHGTHTSSTAGGSSVIVSGSNVTVTDNHANATYGGMAPGADLYLAGINGLNDTYLSNALSKIITYADQQGKPLVVSNSWGSQFGPHDGTGDIADIYNSYFGASHPNRVVLFAASNDGGKSKDNEGGGYHLTGTASSSSPLRSILRSASYTNTDAGYYYYGIIANAWARSTSVSNMTCKIYVLNANTGAVLTTVTVNPTTNGASVSGLSSYFSGSLYAYKNYVSSNKTQIMLYTSGLTSRSTSTTTQNGSTYYKSNYTLAVEFAPSSGSSVIDVWGGSYGYFTNYLSTSGYTWTAGTDDGCYSDEATISNVISIGAYATKNGGMNTSYTIGDIADFSSWGTTSTSLTGQYYPWITAPGARLIAGVNHNHTASVDNYSYYGSNYSGDLVVNSSTNPYAYMEGTSMATPTAAGIVALWMQAANTDAGKQNYPNGLTVNDVKTIMAETAIHDNYTDGGANASHFGNGKIDALAGIAYICPQNVPVIAANPTSLDFGEITAGTTTTKTFTVTGQNLEGNISLSKSGNNFTIDKTSITKNSNGTASATVTVTFSPTANTSATYNGTVTLTSTNATTVTVSLTGKGKYNAPALTASPTSLTFTGNTGETYTKTVTITGTNLQGNVSASISGGNGMYSVSPTTITASQATQGYTVTVTYNPTAAGTTTATLNFTTVGTGAGTASVAITGTSTTIVPVITANPTSLSFEGKIGQTLTKTINVKGANLKGNITATLTGDNVFSINTTNITVSQAQSNNGYNITVTYIPTDLGSYSGQIKLSSSEASSVNIPITGAVLAPELIADPTTLRLESKVGGTATASFIVAGENLISPITATLADANGVFTINPTNITIEQAEGDNGYTVNVTFAPQATGEYTGSVTLSSNKAESVVVNLSGHVMPPSITATPSELTIQTGIGRSATATFTVKGQYLATGITATFGENEDNAFSIDHNSITIEEAEAADGYVVTVTFTPPAKDSYIGEINLTSGEAATSVIVYGEVLNPTLLVEPTQLTITTGVNKPKTATFTVMGQYLAGPVTATLSDANGVFSIDNNNISIEQAENEDGYTATVTFTPTVYSESNYTGTITLSTPSGDSQTVSLIGKVNEPEMVVDPESLIFSTDINTSTTKTIDVLGADLVGNVTVTLNDPSGVFTINPETITAEDAEEGAMVNVTFQSATDGIYTGSVTFTTEGVDPITVTLSATASDGGTASDDYLNVAKYATIDEAGMGDYTGTYLYKYTEYDNDGVAWLTLPAYGAHLAAADQGWITSGVTAVTTTYGSWSATDIFKGNTEYGTNGATYYVRNGTSYTTQTMTYFVTNCTQVKVYGYNESASGNRTYPAYLYIYECTKNADGTITAANATTDQESFSTKSSNFTLTSIALDESKIYKVVVSTTKSRVYEIGFKTPLNKPILTVSPAQVAMRANPGETYSTTVNVKARMLSDNVTVTLSDPSNVFAVSAQSIAMAEAESGTDITVTFSAPEYEGTFTGTVTLTSGTLTTTVSLKGVCAAGGTASDLYLDIAKCATIDEAGATVSGMSTIYKYIEYEDDNVGWLTLSSYGAMKVDANQNWLTTTSLSQYNNSWNANDVFQGQSSYFGSSQAYSIYGSGNQTFYVTNCTQVKAYVKGGNNSTSNATLAIYECAENADGTITVSTSAVDSKQGTTGVIASATLDPRMIYMVRLTGGGSYPDFLEIGFCTPLPTKVTLAQIANEPSIVVGKEYRIVDENLIAAYVGNDEKTIYCKDDNGYNNPVEMQAGQTDFMKSHGWHTGSWDQSNWIVLNVPEGKDLTQVPIKHKLKGVRGVLVNKVNPTLNLTKLPTNGEMTSVSLNDYLATNFDPSMMALTGDYFFVPAKPMEVVNVWWAMWDAGKDQFVVASPVYNSVGTIDGAFYADFSLYNDPSHAVGTLEDGGVYNFTGFGHLNVNKVNNTTKNVMPLDEEAPTGFVVYPLDNWVRMDVDDDGTITSINGIFTDGYREVVGVEYVNGMGMTSDKPFQGLNIVVTRYSDGTHTAVKKIFK